MSKIVYSGAKFREFLLRRGITYQDAAAYLGIDKNTIGKAVRGGNLNMSVLLTICNKYHLSITDFFISEPGEEESQSYENRLNSSPVGVSEHLSTVSEEFEKYKISKKSPFSFEDLLSSKDHEIALLREMNELYKVRLESMQEKLTLLERKKK